MPSRVRYPCSASEAALRGRPVSQTSTLRRQRPRMRAALSPAGPAPTMTTSQSGTGSGPPGARARDGGEARILAQRFEIGIAADARGGERRQLAVDALQHVEGAIGVATQRQQARDVVARERIVRALRDV